MTASTPDHVTPDLPPAVEAPDLPGAETPADGDRPSEHRDAPRERPGKKSPDTTTGPGEESGR